MVLDYKLRPKFPKKLTDHSTSKWLQVMNGHWQLHWKDVKWTQDMGKWLVMTMGDINPNTIKSYKNYLKNMQHIAQSTYIISRHGKTCLSKQPPWRAAGDPCLARDRSRVWAPALGDALRALFSSPSLPSSFGRYILAPSPPTPQKC